MAREHYSREPIRDQSAERRDRAARVERREDTVEPVRREDLHSSRQGLRKLDEKQRQETDVYTRGLLSDDGTRATAIERVRGIRERAREATSRLCDGVQRLSENVRHYISGEQKTVSECERLNRASAELKYSTPAVGKALQHEQMTNRDREIGFKGMSL